MISPPSDQPLLAPSSPDLVWFSGSDALRFLNDLISQEIGDLEDGQVRRSFLLGPEGRLAFLLKVFRSGDRFGLLTDPGRGDDLVTTLGRYRIRVDVEIELETGELWVVVGEHGGLDISWPTIRRSLVLGDRPDFDTLDPESYEGLRVGAGVPRWGVDVDEDTIPHESGLVPESVDFTKGCFLGQELVARIDSRGGNVPRRLRHVTLESLGANAGTEITKGDKAVGRLTSVAGLTGLGLIHRSAEPGDAVSAGDIGGVVKSLPIETMR